ncbi:unnamed protein product, partial [Mesorhabditis spiculigera]
MPEKDENKDLYDDIQLTGLKYLKEKNTIVRCLWGAVVVLFIGLTIYQIQSQLADFMEYPVVTNIEAEYPETIFFPAIAICNNNQYSIGYLASDEVLKRMPADNRTINATWPLFKKVLNTMWDVPADQFLRKALPPLNATILSCHLPNGTECNPDMWKQIWTINGLCWAFNNDRDDPLVIEQPGASHGLKLVLNAESYDRPLTCGAGGSAQAENGFKVLIYNQTDVPVSTANAVSVTPGVSTNIPLRIVSRTKLPGTGCREETQESLDAANDYFNGNNIRTCTGRIYHEAFEKKCSCTFRHLYTGLDVIPEGDICDVEMYFGCVQFLQAKISVVTESRAKNECIPTCEQLEFVAQQDLSELPKSVLPLDQVYTADMIQTERQEVVGRDENGTRIYRRQFVDCEESEYITAQQVTALKARMADILEKRSRYEDIDRREFQSLIESYLWVKKVQQDEGYPADPLDRNSSKTILEAITYKRSAFYGCEEWLKSGIRKEQLNDTNLPVLLRTKISDVVVWEDLERLNTFNLALRDYLAFGQTKYQFADAFLFLNIDYMFEHDFPKNWKKPIDDLLTEAQRVLKAQKAEFIDGIVSANTNTEMSIPSFDRALTEDCVVQLESGIAELRRSFESGYLQFTKTFDEAFTKHFRQYREKFLLKEEFKKQNMAVVNIYIRSNTVEKWTQKWQYTFWSLACDVGGALGLFIGVSVASLLEIFYVLYQHLNLRRLRKAHAARVEAYDMKTAEKNSNLV